MNRRGFDLRCGGILAAAIFLLALAFLAPADDAPDPAPAAPPAASEDPPEVVLGERLFIDRRFSNPDADEAISCRICHLVDEEKEERGMRAYTDFYTRSKVPVRLGDPRREEARNSPIMLDADEMPALHWDGEFRSLEELTIKTLSTRNMGWLEGEEQEAFDHVYTELVEDRAFGLDPGVVDGTYAEQFKKVYGVDIKAVGRDAAIGWIAKSVSDYMRSLKTARDTPFDVFMQLNAFPPRPEQGQAPEVYAAGLLKRVKRLEADGKLRMPAEGFGAEELRGFKIFFNARGPERAGSCVLCHVPPTFTDFSFHNTGIAQKEYDGVHGAGAFAKLSIPGPDAKRPLESLRNIPAKDHPELADLGHWNFADLEESPLRNSGESDEAFLARMAATFKTPTLRDLKFTNPYMHNGAFAAVEDALRQYIVVSMAAQAGEVRAGDERLKRIAINSDDIAPLAAFLNSLNDHYE